MTAAEGSTIRDFVHGQDERFTRASKLAWFGVDKPVVQQSQSIVITMPPTRVVDEDLDKGVTDALIDLSSRRVPA